MKLLGIIILFFALSVGWAYLLSMFFPSDEIRAILGTLGGFAIGMFCGFLIIITDAVEI